MSQWGAYGLAQMGWSHKRILKHFYRGTRVERLADPVRKIRVGLTWDRTVIHLERQGRSRCGCGSGAKGGARSGASPPGAPGRCVPRSSGFAVRDHDGKLVGGHTWGGAALRPDRHVRRRAPAPSCRGRRGQRRRYAYNRGSPRVQPLPSAVARGTSGSCCRSPFEQYLYGLGEMPSSWPAAGAARAGRGRSHVRDLQGQAVRPERASATATSPTAPTTRSTSATTRKAAPTATAGSRP